MAVYLYILEDDNKKFYIGSTNNLERRIAQHRSGHTQTTRRMKNPRLVFKQQYNSLSRARIIEKRLKKMKRKDYIEKIIKDGYIKIN